MQTVVRSSSRHLPLDVRTQCSPSIFCRNGIRLSALIRIFGALIIPLIFTACEASHPLLGNGSHSEFGQIGADSNGRFNRAKIFAEANSTTQSVVLKPTSDIARVSMTNQSGSTASLYKSVDDGILFSDADDDTTFIRTTGGRAKHQVGYSGGPAGTFNQVVIHFRARGNDFTGTAQVQIYDGTLLVATGRVYPLSSTYTDFSDTLKGFTTTNINNLRSEILLVGGNLRYTQTWIEASYVLGNEPGQGYWAPAGNIDFGRDGHTTTLLTNGKLLIAGGNGTSGYDGNKVAIFDPVTQSAGILPVPPEIAPWLPVSLPATRLMNGNVLLVGNGFSALYDPTEGELGALKPTGATSIYREYHTATLLNNGKVLVVGGAIGNPTAELYDPATGMFTYTNPINTDRKMHTATLLSDGKVLIAGGYTSEGCTQSAEIYDPTTHFFTRTGDLPMPMPMCSETNTVAPLLPNGKVLWVGNGFHKNSAFLFDPTTGTFSVLEPMVYFHNHPSVTLLSNGKVLIAGGTHGSVRFSKLNIAEIFDPDTNSFAPAASMTVSRVEHTATLMPNGQVLVVGGYPLTSVEAYSYLGSDPTQITLKPKSDFSRTSVTSMANSTASMYLFVDEATKSSEADGDSTYLTTTGGNAKHGVGYSGAPALGTNQVVVHFSARTDSGKGTAQVKLYNGSTLIGTGPIQTLSNHYQQHSASFKGLSVSNINNLKSELLLKTTSSGGNLRYTATWIDVSPIYVPSPAKLTTGTTRLSFGEFPVGATSPAQSFQITNVGQKTSGALAITPSLGEFAILTGEPGDCVPGVTTLAAAASCTVRIAFTPTSTAGIRSGMIAYSAMPGAGGSVMVSGSSLGCPAGELPWGSGIVVTCRYIAGTRWQESLPSSSWSSVAASTDGTKIFVAGNFNGFIRTSVDSGEHWINRGPQKDWRAIASSSDGVKLIAGTFPGSLFTSSDSGGTWSQVPGTEGKWVHVASSADGTRLWAADFESSKLFSSEDSGATWVPQTLGAGGIAAVATSALGEKVAAIDTTGNIHVSSDYGVTWSSHPTSASLRSVVMSASGEQIVVSRSYGPVHFSSDGGTSWGDGVNHVDWGALAITPNGMKVVGISDNGTFFYSTNNGESFFQNPDRLSWRTLNSIAISADGNKLVVVGKEGEIFTSAFGGTSTWVERHSVSEFNSVTQSFSGGHVVATRSGGYIQYSRSSGMNWSDRHEKQYWTSIASSYNGMNVIAGSYYLAGVGSAIQTSYIGGDHDSWVKHPNLPEHGDFVDWVSVASDRLGKNLLAVGSRGQLVISKDYGSTWEAGNVMPIVPIDAPVVKGWTLASMSRDGMKMAAVNSDGFIYLSTDEGVTWNMLPGPSASWNTIFFPGDATKLFGATQTEIRVSTDLGQTWAVVKSGPIFKGAAFSWDGSKIVAIEYTGPIWNSLDGGATWISNLESLYMPWSAVSMSADGSRMTAVSSSGASYYSIGPVP